MNSTHVLTDDHMDVLDSAPIGYQNEWWRLYGRLSFDNAQTNHKITRRVSDERKQYQSHGNCGRLPNTFRAPF